MFKRFRIAILLYILLFVALGQYLAGKRSTDWNNSLWVDVYPVNVSGSTETDAYIDSLKPDDFAAIADFFAGQAGEYGITLDQPFLSSTSPSRPDCRPPRSSSSAHSRHEDSPSSNGP